MATHHHVSEQQSRCQRRKQFPFFSRLLFLFVLLLCHTEGGGDDRWFNIGMGDRRRERCFVDERERMATLAKSRLIKSIHNTSVDWQRNHYFENFPPSNQTDSNQIRQKKAKIKWPDFLFLLPPLNILLSLRHRNRTERQLLNTLQTRSFFSLAI